MALSDQTARLERWIEAERAVALPALLACVSAADATKARPEFGQAITPAPGSVVAARTIEADQKPDYFFHWTRDSALVMDALIEAMTLGWIDEDPARWRDFVAFSLRLTRLDGRALVASGGIGRTNVADLQRFLRTAIELETIHDDRVLAEARFNPDATLDVLKWSSPQFDGPALRALTLIKLLSSHPHVAAAFAGEARALLRRDLEFTLRCRAEPCYDLWEDRFGHHYYTRLVAHAALARAAQTAAREAGQETGQEAGQVARAYAEGAAELMRMADAHWSPAHGHYAAATKGLAPVTARDLDSAILLAVCHAALQEGPHSPLDPRVHASLDAIETLFARIFSINARLAPAGPLVGRFEGDEYYGGGVFVMASLAAAQIHYQIARLIAGGAYIPCTPDNRHWLQKVSGETFAIGARVPARAPDAAALARRFFERGDARLEALRALAPEGARLPEQFDRDRGEPRSARGLAWSHAAFLTATAARQRARTAIAT